MVRQKGPVSVGRPIGEKKEFIAPWANTVATMPITAQMAAFQEKLQNVAPKAMPVSTAEKP